VRLATARNLVAVAACAILFGTAVSLIKGNASGVRDAIGNASAPWLLLPFVAGAATGRGALVKSALMGALASILALGAFYFANSFVLELGPHSWPYDLRLTLESGHLYLGLGLLSGPSFGALGGWWARSRSIPVGVGVAGLLVFEPLAWFAYGWRYPGAAGLSNYPLAWLGEVAVGLGMCALMARLTGPTPFLERD
jgi:hypothetical protein